MTVVQRRECKAGSSQRSDQVRDYLDALFSDQLGHVAVARGEHPSLEGAKVKWEHWEEESFRWPEDRGTLVEALTQLADDDDVFVAPQLMTVPSRSNAAAAGGRWLHVDKDTALSPTQRSLLEDLRASAHILVRSGSPDRFHFYLRLERELGPEERSRLNRRLAKALGGEKWEGAALLRPPGAFNYKGTVSGGRRRRVVAEEWATDLPDCTVTRLESLLPAPAPYVGTVVVGSAAVTRGQVDEQQPPPWLDRLMTELPRAGEGEGRSGQFFHLVMCLNEHGYHYDDVLMYAISHTPTLEKWPDPAIIEQRMSALLALHDHRGRNCKEAGCANARDDSHDGLSVRTAVAVLRGLVAVATWPPRKGSSMRALVLAACQAAEWLNRTEFFFSVDDFAVVARMHRNTVSNRLLDIDPWLERVRPGDGQRAARWRLRTDVVVPHMSTAPPSTTHAVCVPSWGPSADAFRFRALGRTAERIYYSGQDEPRTPQQFGALVDVTARTALTNLRKLEQHELAVKQPEGWVLVPASDEHFKAIAAMYSTLDRGQLQERQVIHRRRQRRDALKSQHLQALLKAQSYQENNLLRFAAYQELLAYYYMRQIKWRDTGAVGVVAQVRQRKTVGGDIARAGSHSPR